MLNICLYLHVNQKSDDDDDDGMLNVRIAAVILKFFKYLNYNWRNLMLLYFYYTNT